MIKPHKLYDRIKQGHYHNINFDDFIRLIQQLGFVYHHTTGSHRIFNHPTYKLLFNIQPDSNRNAKAAQVRELQNIINKYTITLGD